MFCWLFLRWCGIRYNFFCRVQVPYLPLMSPSYTYIWLCSQNVTAISEYRSWEILVRVRFCKKELDKLEKTSQINPSPLFKARFQSWALPSHIWEKSCVNCLARRFAQTAISSRVRGNFGEEFASRDREDKSNMFYIWLARQIPHCVRPSWESSWARSIKHPIKIHGILT